MNVYRIADMTICIDSIYDTVQRLCADYRIETEASDTNISTDFTVQIMRSDIEFERSKSTREGIGDVSSDAYLETLAVYRKIAERAPYYDTVLVHGSCVSVDGVGYLFTAQSGTGKSTHTRLWRKLLGDRAVMVNDDKPMIRLTDDSAVIYGTPWDGKHKLSNNISVPLKSICILERSDQNSIRPVSKEEAYPMLLQQIYRPMDITAMQKTLMLIDKLTQSVKLWQLGCNISIEAARIAYTAMKE